MTWLFALGLLLSIGVVAMFAAAPSQHSLCLQSIGRLESELFPDLPKELRWARWPSVMQYHPTLGRRELSWDMAQEAFYRPGAVWQVDDASTIQVRPKIEWLEEPRRLHEDPIQAQAEGATAGSPAGGALSATGEEALPRHEHSQPASAVQGAAPQASEEQSREAV